MSFNYTLNNYLWFHFFLKLWSTFTYDSHQFYQSTTVNIVCTFTVYLNNEVHIHWNNLYVVINYVYINKKYKFNSFY